MRQGLSMAVTAEKRTFSVDELWELSHRSDRLLELVRGELREMAPTAPEHGFVELRLGARLMEFVEKQALGAVVTGEVGFVLRATDPATVRAADVAFISAKKLPDGDLPKKFPYFAPDLVAEILSPNDAYGDVMEKVNDWLAAGVNLVWVVDPAHQVVHVYRIGQPVHVLQAGDRLSGEDVLPGFECAVSEIFAR